MVRVPRMIWSSVVLLLLCAFANNHQFVQADDADVNNGQPAVAVADAPSSGTGLDDAESSVGEPTSSTIYNSKDAATQPRDFYDDDQPTSGEQRFVAVHVNKLGATEHLNPSLVGLTNMAIKFLPSNYKFQNVLSATREVVAGVRFNILVNAAEIASGETIICEFMIMEKPWIVTKWGDKLRTLEYTNCTQSDDEMQQMTTPIDENDFNFNPMFAHRYGIMTDEMIKTLDEQIIIPKEKKATKAPSIDHNVVTNEVSDDFLKNLEDSIIVSKTVVKSHSNQPEINYNNIKTKPIESVPNKLDDSVTAALDELFLYNNAASKNQESHHTIIPTTSIYKSPEKVFADIDNDAQYNLKLNPNIIYSTDPIISNQPNSEEIVIHSIGEKNPTTTSTSNPPPAVVFPSEENESSNIEVALTDLLDQILEGFHSEMPYLNKNDNNQDVQLKNPEVSEAVDNADNNNNTPKSDKDPIVQSEPDHIPMPILFEKNIYNSHPNANKTIADTKTNENTQNDHLLDSNIQTKNDEENEKDVGLEFEKDLQKTFTNSPEAIDQFFIDYFLKHKHLTKELIDENTQFQRNQSAVLEQTTEPSKPIPIIPTVMFHVGEDDPTNIIKSENVMLINADVAMNDFSFVIGDKLKKNPNLMPSSTFDIIYVQLHFMETNDSGIQIKTDADTETTEKNISRPSLSRNKQGIYQIFDTPESESVRIKHRKKTIKSKDSDESSEKSSESNEKETQHRKYQSDVSQTADRRLRRKNQSNSSESSKSSKSSKSSNSSEEKKKNEKTKNASSSSSSSSSSSESDDHKNNNKKGHHHSKREISLIGVKENTINNNLILIGLTERTSILYQIDQTITNILHKILLPEYKSQKIFLVNLIFPDKDCNRAVFYMQQCLDTYAAKPTGLCKIQIHHTDDLNQIHYNTDECYGNKKRAKRQLVGAPLPIESPDKDIENLVKEALVSLGNQDGSTYSLVKIESATKQVVAGIRYKIHAEFKSAADNSASTTCLFDIWDRPWIKVDGREVTIDCGKDKRYKLRQRRSLNLNLSATRKTASDEHIESLFHKFKLKYHRNYDGANEHNLRLQIFKKNLDLIKQLNQHEQGTAKYGITQFADFTPDEFKRRTGLLPQEERQSNEIKNAEAIIPDIALPKHFDWREKGAITEVKDQGNCGSCWAFSVTGNIEGLHAIKYGMLEEYSEQELVDCDTIDSGCNGGLPDNAYKSIEQLGGLELESAYPYSARKETCRFNKNLSKVRVTGAIDLPKNETAIAQWLTQNGPVSIGINANAMQFYRGGVSHPMRLLCRHTNIDHGVLIVGYGVAEYPVFNKTLPYWIIKNSWGPKWGEQGFYRVFRGDNTCGVTSMVSSAVLA